MGLYTEVLILGVILKYMVSASLSCFPNMGVNISSNLLSIGVEVNSISTRTRVVVMITFFVASTQVIIISGTRSELVFVSSSMR